MAYNKAKLVDILETKKAEHLQKLQEGLESRRKDVQKDNDEILANRRWVRDLIRSFKDGDTEFEELLRKLTKTRAKSSRYWNDVNRLESAASPLTELPTDLADSYELNLITEALTLLDALDSDVVSNESVGRLGLARIIRGRY